MNSKELISLFQNCFTNFYYEENDLKNRKNFLKCLIENGTRVLNELVQFDDVDNFHKYFYILLKNKNHLRRLFKDKKIIISNIKNETVTSNKGVYHFSNYYEHSVNSVFMYGGGENNKIYMFKKIPWNQTYYLKNGEDIFTWKELVSYLNNKKIFTLGFYFEPYTPMALNFPYGHFSMSGKKIENIYFYCNLKKNIYGVFPSDYIYNPNEEELDFKKALAVFYFNVPYKNELLGYVEMFNFTDDPKLFTIFKLIAISMFEGYMSRNFPWNQFKFFKRCKTSKFFNKRKRELDFDDASNIKISICEKNNF